jgi:hypothetical protein
MFRKLVGQAIFAMARYSVSTAAKNLLWRYVRLTIQIDSCKPKKDAMGCEMTDFRQHHKRGELMFLMLII